MSVAWVCRFHWAGTCTLERDQLKATPTFVDAEPRVLGGDVLPQAIGIWMSHLQMTEKVCPRMLKVRTRGSHLMTEKSSWGQA